MNKYNKHLAPRKFSRFAIENGCIALEQLHAGGGYVIYSMCGWSKRKGGEPEAEDVGAALRHDFYIFMTTGR